jgi:thiosulfate reductase cytochrome b subunit
VIFNLGGAEAARTLHHFGALITFLYFGLHLGKLAIKGWQSRARFHRRPALQMDAPEKGSCFGPDSMIPTWQDAKDFVAHQKWFFGKGPKPQFDRWTYWEKFDYFAVFWGVFAIGMSGLVMWFPQFFTHFCRAG